MKNVLSTIVLSVALLYTTIGQAQNNTITVKTQPSFSQSFNNGLKAGAAVRAARAAELSAKGESTADVSVDELNINNYKSIVFTPVGWKPKANSKAALKILKNGELPAYDNRKQKYSTNEDGALYIKWVREADDQVNRTTIIVAKNSNGEIVYRARHYNTSYATMLEPFLLF